MKRKRFTEEQIIGVLREQEAGVPTADLCRKHGVSSATFYKWKSQVRRSGGVRREAAEGARGRERPAEAAAGGCDARQRGAEGSAVEKMVTPAAKREAVVHLRRALRDERAAGVPGDRLRADDGALSIASDRTTWRYASGCGRWPRSAGGSAIVGSTCCCAARATPSTASGCSGSTARSG